MKSRMLINVDPSKCTGCRMCEMACSLIHTGQCSPSLARINVVKNEEQGIHLPVLCMQCSDAPCIKACPKAALYQDQDSGWVLIKEDLCIGCKLCHMACPVGAFRFPKGTKKVVKCNLCGGDPNCVKFCEPGALQLIAEINFHQRKSLNILSAFELRSDIGKAVKHSPIPEGIRI